MNKPRQNPLRLLMTAMLLFAAIAVIGLFPKPTQAASYKYVDLYSSSSGLTKSGDYYLKLGSNYTTIYIATSKKGTYYKTPMAEPLYSNGTNAYYIRKNALYRFDFKTRKETKLKSLTKYLDLSNADWPDYMHISYIYSNYIYMTRDCGSSFKAHTYCYNISTGKVTRVIKGHAIMNADSKYVVTTPDYVLDVSPQELDLWKIDKSTGKLSLICPLSADGGSPTFVGDYIYFVDYPNIHIDKDGTSYTVMNKAVLYRIKKDGTGLKKIKTFTISDEWGIVYVYDITSTDCKLMKNDKFYQYTYKTKKYKSFDPYAVG